MDKEKILIETAREYNVNPDYFLIENNEVIWNVWDYTIKEFIFIPEERFVIPKEEFMKFKEDVEKKLKGERKC